MNNNETLMNVRHALMGNTIYDDHIILKICRVVSVSNGKIKAYVRKD